MCEWIYVFFFLLLSFKFVNVVDFRLIYLNYLYKLYCPPGIYDYYFIPGGGGGGDQTLMDVFVCVYYEQ